MTPTPSDYQAFKRAPKGQLDPTGKDIEGPFYKPGAPELYDGGLCPDPDLTLFGLVVDADGRPVGGAVLDVWQADAAGNYDDAGFRFRGKVRTNPGGRYVIRTVRPGFYKISDPGEPDEFRCSHIHVKVSAPGCRGLTTQLYFADSPHDDTDHWFDPKRCVRPVSDCDPTQVLFEFVLEKA